MATNPYAAIALKDENNPYKAIAIPSAQQGEAIPGTSDPGMGNAVATTAKAAGKLGSDVLQGVGEGTIGLMSTGDQWARQHLPAFFTNRWLGFGAPANEKHIEQLATPENTTQAVAKGGEKAAEFMIPGGAEERAISLAPKAIRPIARMATSVLSSGLVNKAQGGGFGTGALAGGTGAAIGEGLRAAAPRLAEAALHIGHAQRAFNKTPGAAALELTRGVRPESVLSSGRESMGGLMNALEGQVNAASVRPTPRIAGFLQPPRETVELAPIPGREPASSPMAFPAASDRGTPRIYNQTQYHSGGAHPELSGRIEQPQGNMTRTPQMSASIPPTSEPNPVASLRPARELIANAQGKAAREEAGTLHGQLGEMGNFLHRGRVSGEEIPENVTPRRLLDLKRGFSDEHLRWNPNVHQEAMHTGRGAYGALDRELDRLVPGAAPINQKISSLIEVLHNAERESRMAGPGQRMLGRFGAHTGALTGAGIGGALGYREGGTPGAIGGMALGVAAPELLASPEGQMALARTFNRAGTLRPAVGGLLAASRVRKEGQQ